jgi:hypothetical protein
VAKGGSGRDTLGFKMADDDIIQRAGAARRKVAIEKAGGEASILYPCRIVIPLKERVDFMVGLRSCGITETTICPDLDGLAKELVTEYGGLDLPK